jgi:threonine synthase
MATIPQVYSTTIPVSTATGAADTMSSSASPSVTYRSTRGGTTNMDFRYVVMQGLATDKGLYVPESIPAISPDELQSWRSLSFPDLAIQVISKFVKDDQIPAANLRDIVHRSCGAFRHTHVTPVVQVGGHAVLVRAYTSLQ